MMATEQEEQLASIVQALRRAGAPAWEVYFEEERELSIEVQDGEVDAYETASALGAGIRVREDDRTGFAFTCDLSQSAIRETVRAARAAAHACDPEPLETLTHPDDARDLPEVPVLDRELARTPIAHKIDLACRLEAAARAGSPRIARVRKASYGEGWARTRLVNSNGLDLTDESTLVHCDVLAVAEDDDDEQLGWEAQTGHFLRELDVLACGRVAAERAVRQLGARKVHTGRYRAVIEPTVVCEILDVLSESLLGENVAKGRSLLGSKIGQACMGRAVTLVDDGTHPQGAATSRFDAEGMPRRRTVLVEDGVLRGFLYDRFWGARAGACSTGNSDRGGFRGQPQLATSNLILMPGRDADTLALCREIGEGLLVSELIGIHTADPVSGDFSLGASGQRVRGGQPGAPFAGVAVAGNLLGLLRSIVAVGAPLRFYGSAGAPPIVVEGLEVAGE
jgi:PmbA protein